MDRQEGHDDYVSKKNRTTSYIFLCFCSIRMYVSARKQRQEIPYADQLESMQKAVDAYQENSGGLLPIKTRDLETDIYIKYPIEFSKIVPAYTEKILRMHMKRVESINMC